MENKPPYIKGCEPTPLYSAHQVQGEFPAARSLLEKIEVYCHDMYKPGNPPWPDIAFPL